uniref:SMP domain-containing protein n=1 Tax=Rhizophora mucronata TaxID=61149 RepID=A0A2P2QLA2_RHIMU
MSQEQPKRHQDPINCRDIFVVHGDLAGDSVALSGAAMMQAAPENAMMGQTPKGVAMSTMQSAATGNEKAGPEGHDVMSDAAGDHGVSVTRTDLPDGSGAMIPSVGGQDG